MTSDDALAEKMRMIANHGQSKRYYHDIVGCNSRLDTIQAAILDIKLNYLDQYIAARRDLAAAYDSAFAGNTKIQVPYQAPNSRHVFHQYTLILDGVDRNALYDYLATQSIPSMIYYPVPAHRQQMFARYNASQTDLPVTDWLTERVISLPMHTEMDEEQINFVTTHVLKYLNS
jgi:dTDP-4-amino-4,6-dideoxygalactose transaminase